MAQERPLTPEKQLLNLIEGGQKSEAPGKSAEARAVRHRGLSFLSLGAWIGRISFSREHLREWFKSGGYRRLDINTINRILSLLVFALAVYIAVNIPLSLKGVEGEVPSNFGIPEKLKAAALPVTPLLKNAASFYVEKVTKRDIFQMGRPAQEAAPEEKGAEAETAPLTTSRIMEATQHLKLVGVSWSSDPDAMIEDTNALKTYFLKRGQMIGDIRLEAIFKDKVILSFEGEEIELR